MDALGIKKVVGKRKILRSKIIVAKKIEKKLLGINQLRRNGDNKDQAANPNIPSQLLPRFNLRPQLVKKNSSVG